MSRFPTFEQRAAHYRYLWNTMEFDPGQKAACMEHARRVMRGKAEYLKVQKALGTPWWWVGITHLMEAFCDFTRHPHNGDPLTARTKQVPAGRPLKGSPPFTWFDSAIDALTMKGLQRIADWSIERCLYEWERYNGWGYALYHPGENTPYLWARTNHNDGTGKYIADGKWSATAPSEKQCGAAAVLRCLMELDSTISFGPRPMSAEEKAKIGAGGVVAIGVGAGAGAAIEVAQKTPPNAPTTPHSEGWGIAIGVGLAFAIGIGVLVAVIGRRK